MKTPGTGRGTGTSVNERETARFWDAPLVDAERLHDAQKIIRQRNDVVTLMDDLHEDDAPLAPREQLEARIHERRLGGWNLSPDRRTCR